MLSDHQIRAAAHLGWLGIDPYDQARVQPASYDVSLGAQLMVLRSGAALDPKQDAGSEWDLVSIGPDGYVLAGGAFILGSTAETVTLTDSIVGQLEGKSSLGRLGLLVHSTAGYLDPGFVGQVTLELACLHPRGIRLYAGMPVGQIAFTSVSAAEHPYCGKYVGQVGPTLSRYHQNWDGRQWR